MLKWCVIVSSDQSALPILNCAIAKQNKGGSDSLFQPNGHVSMDMNVFNVYFIWALEKKKKTDFIFVLYLFHRMWWKIDWYPLLKSIVLINIGNSFHSPLSSPFKCCDCIPEVALFSGCYWSPCFLTQIPCCPNLPPSQGRANVHTYTHSYICTEKRVRLS